MTINGRVGINPSFNHSFAALGAKDGDAYRMQVVFTDVGPKVTHTGPRNLFALAGGPGLAGSTGGVTYAQPIQTVFFQTGTGSVTFQPNQRSEVYFTLPDLYGQNGGLYLGGTYTAGSDSASFRVDGMFGREFDPTSTEQQAVSNYGLPSIGVNYAASDPSLRFGGYIFMDSFSLEAASAGGWSFDDPMLPNAEAPEGAFGFDFVALPDRTLFFDPVVATGYDYLVSGGAPNITSAIFPTLPGDADGYSVFALNDLINPLFSNVQGGQTVDFTSLAAYANGISGFALRGIDIGAGLDPDDQTAFVTGLNFASGGRGHLVQTAIRTETGTAGVPEPSTWMALVLGFGLLGAVLRSRTARLGPASRWIG